jgi:death on curing protein
MALLRTTHLIDGNKRIGLAALNDFLGLNGCRLAVSQDERIEMVLRVAASEISEAEWTAWVERSVVPVL